MRKFNITVNGTAYQVEVEESPPVHPPRSQLPPLSPLWPLRPSSCPLHLQRLLLLRLPPRPPRRRLPPVVRRLNSPMPGTIVGIKVAQGAAVKKGDVVLILEAMKMENEILAPVDGTIAQIAVAQGASVNSGDLLVVIA